MKIWAEQLMPQLTDKQLKVLHMNCCRLRSNDWRKPYKGAELVKSYKKECLIAYHVRVMNEMQRRGLGVDIMWYSPKFCGKKLGMCGVYNHVLYTVCIASAVIYTEFNTEYIAGDLRLLNDTKLQSVRTLL